MRLPALVVLTALGAGMALPAEAQSVGYVTGFPGRDPAGEDGIGWGPAYRPETSFAQPGTPPTPGEIAGERYRARTGRGVYDDVQSPLGTGAVSSKNSTYGAPAYRTPRAGRSAKAARRDDRLRARASR